MRYDQADRFRGVFITSLTTACVVAASAAAASGTSGTAQPPRTATQDDNSGLDWQTDYSEAYAAAERDKRMLLVNFVAEDEDGNIQRSLERWIAGDAAVREKLQEFVLVRLSTDAQIDDAGERIRLLDHPAFGTLKRAAGVAMIDLRDASQPYYGQVVTALPISSGKYYRWQNSHLNAALDLPPGTISQRTLVWAVRVHPETPASTVGPRHPLLTRVAATHSADQAHTGVQGHFGFESRVAQMRSAVSVNEASEVVAESWPNEGLIDACLDCVASWRQSPGHWGAVRKRHRLFGYDICRGRNGIWYATGIFAD
ncbi:MAG: hypothetical protein WD669_01520 [Pirellulales bacterium]